MPFRNSLFMNCILCNQKRTNTLMKQCIFFCVRNNIKMSMLFIPYLMLLYVQYICSFCLLTVNVALNKPAYHQYPYKPDYDQYNAIKAVDGRKSDLSWEGGQCAVSEYGTQTATWWVNLISIHSIHHIIIYFLTKNRGKVTQCVSYK